MTTGSPDHDRLIEQTHADLVRLGRSRGLQLADAEDAAQEASARALEHAESFTRHAGPRAWLFRVTGNLLVDHWRRRSTEALTAALDQPSTAPEPADRAEHREQVAIAMRALHNVTPRYAQVFWDHDVEGVPAADIAAELGVSQVTFRQLLHRARRAVRAEHERLGGSALALVLLVPALRKLSRIRWAVVAPGLAIAVALFVPLPVNVHPAAQPPSPSWSSAPALTITGMDGVRGAPRPAAMSVAAAATGGAGSRVGSVTTTGKPAVQACTGGKKVGGLRSGGACVTDDPDTTGMRYLLIRTPLNGRECGAAQRACDYRPGLGVDGQGEELACDNLPDQPVAYCVDGGTNGPNPDPSAQPSSSPPPKGPAS